MTQNTAAPTTTFALADPRGFDGDPYEVAERAVAQVSGLVRLQLRALADARVMARNAAMDRQPEPDAIEWEASAEAKAYDALIEEVERQAKRLVYLGRSAGFNPKAPLGKA